MRFILCSLSISKVKRSMKAQKNVTRESRIHEELGSMALRWDFQLLIKIISSMGDVCYSHLAKYKGKPNYTFLIHIISTCKVLQILGYIGSFPANLHKFLLLVMLQRGLFFVANFMVFPSPTLNTEQFQFSLPQNFPKMSRHYHFRDSQTLQHFCLCWYFLAYNYYYTWLFP